jgi:transposase-like protein
MIRGLVVRRPVCGGAANLRDGKAALVLVAVEKRGRATGRARMAVIPDFKSTTLIAFLKQNVAPGTAVYTDGLKTFTGLREAGFKHVPRSQPLRGELRKGAKSVVPLADRAIGNLQQWLIGTYHGVSRDQLQIYLDEFVFAITCAGRPWRHSKRCWVWGAVANHLPMTRYVARQTCLNSPMRINHNLLRVAETTG